MRLGCRIRPRHVAQRGLRHPLGVDVEQDASVPPAAGADDGEQGRPAAQQDRRSSGMARSAGARSATTSPPRWGGAIYSGAMTIDKSTFLGNHAGFYGGAPYSVGALTVDHSTFSGNSAILGGGVFIFTGVLAIEHSSITQNTAVSGGARRRSSDLRREAALAFRLVAGTRCRRGRHAADVHGLRLTSPGRARAHGSATARSARQVGERHRGQRTRPTSAPARRDGYEAWAEAIAHDYEGLVAKEVLLRADQLIE